MLLIKVNDFDIETILVDNFSEEYFMILDIYNNR